MLLASSLFGKEVKGQRTSLLVELGVVKVGDDALDLVDRAVPIALVSFCLCQFRFLESLSSGSPLQVGLNLLSTGS